MKFNINTRIDISFTEEQITDALTKLIQEEMPGIQVESIEYVAKRNPSRTEAVVNAQLEGYTPPTAQEETAEQVPEVVPDKQLSLDLEDTPKITEQEPVKEKEEVDPSSVETVADLFNTASV